MTNISFYFCVCFRVVHVHGLGHAGSGSDHGLRWDRCKWRRCMLATGRRRGTCSQRGPQTQHHLVLVTGFEVQFVGKPATPEDKESCAAWL